MANFPVGKVDGNQLQPADWNQIASLNNAVSSTSQTPSDADLNQISKSFAEYAASSTFYTDSGSANDYTLTSIDSLEAPASYVDGMTVRFRTANANTGASVVNVATLGDIDITQSDGTSNLTAGQISTTQDTILRYDSVLGVFIIPYINPSNLVPIGTIITFAGSAPSGPYVPSGFLHANGATISRTVYSALFSAIRDVFGAGDGTTTFNIPDLRGEFIRGWDNGRGIDAGRTFGSTQGDAFQNITSTVGISRDMTTGGTGAFSQTPVSSQLAGSGSVGSQPFRTDFDASNASGVRTAAETRPHNIALLHCIKY